MDDGVVISLRVNGKPVTRRVEPRRHLTDFLRIDLGLTGSHLGCEHGVCGACGVQVDGRSIRGCLMLAVQADGSDVVTIEGLSEAGQYADLQENFVRRNAAQCGFCTSGMIFTAIELLDAAEPVPRAGIRDALSGNYCRCTGYHAIVDAIEQTLRERLGGSK